MHLSSTCALKHLVVFSREKTKNSVVFKYSDSSREYNAE